MKRWSTESLLLVSGDFSPAPLFLFLRLLTFSSALVSTLVSS